MKIKAKSLGIAILALFLIAFLALGSLYLVQNVDLPGLDISGGGKASPPSPAVGVAQGTPEPIQFVLTDSLAGGNISNAVLTVYSSNNQQTDSLTTADASGAATTSSLWTPGQTGYVFVSLTNYVYECVPFTVPSTASIGQYGTPSYYIPLKDCLLGTYTIKCFDNFGNQYTTGQTINFTTLASNHVTLSFTIYNSVANTGYITTYDKLNNVNQACGLTMYTTGSSVSLPSGITGGSQAQTFPRGTSTYWSSQFTDSSLTNQWVGSNQVLSGQAPFSISVNQAALAAGDSQTFTLGLVAPFDSGYYQANGVGGPNAASLTTFTFIMGA